MIYRYFSAARAIEAIREGRLFVNNPAKYNDPYEFAPKITVDSITSEELNALSLQPEIIHRNYLASDQKVSFEVFREQYIQSESRLLLARSKIPDLESHIVEAFGAKIGVIAFSRIKHSIPMWSYYADSHKGVVLGFDEECVKTFFTDSMLDIEYKSERVKYRHYDNEPMFLSMMKKIAKRKFEEWSHEDEVRILVPWELTVQNKFFKYPAHWLKEVVFGMKAGDSTRRVVKQLLCDRQLEPQLLKAKRCPSTYSVGFEEI